MNRPAHQHGFALPTLMLMLSLASIAALLAMRNVWVNEQLLNAEADQQRTQQKAEAVLPLALADILGASTPNAGGATPQLRHTAGDVTQTHAFFPSSQTEYDLLRKRLGVNTCSAGICAPNALASSAAQASYWRAQIATAMQVSAVDSPDGDNTAGYWVEVFPQTNNSAFVYRITALANGVRPGSTTVLQALWVRNTATSSSGQWRSWHLLHD
jgi:Tfp pilus assembly protein PilX